MDKLKMQTENLADKNFEVLSKMFPNALTETITGYDDNGKPIVERAIDADVLRQEISCKVVEGKDERYQFTWPDKKKAVLLANTPIDKTLRPCREESVDFDNTENLYIEGDNLDVLKILQETYLEKVKVIYIDPPYNTGNDFVYKDDFSISNSSYIENSGQMDEQGNRLVQNMESNGRYHTDWLNMMYPRLRVAKSLLSKDGVIFISIDYNEVYNLRNICNEIFGSQNFVGEIIWRSATDNNPSQIAMEHEYILCYAKNLSEQPKWLIKSSKATLIEDKYNELSEKYGKENIKQIQDELKKWIKEHSEELQGVSHYTYVDEIGVYYPGNSSNTKPGGYMFDIIHPITKKVCNKPDYGYRWTEKTFWDADSRGDVEWGKDENTIPKIKKRIDTVTEMLKSYYYEDSRYWTKYLNKLLGGRVFDNPKSVNLLIHLLEYVVNENDIVMDFFSGSGSTAHAVMQLNINGERIKNNKYICIQIPEAVSEKSEAYKKGYSTICDIAKNRIKLVGKELIENNKNIKKFDAGFRVLKLDSSNMKDIYYNPSETQQSLFDTYADNIKEDRTPEDLLFQVMLDLGVLPSSKIEETTIAGKIVFNVADGFLIACFDKDVTEETVKAVAEKRPYYAVFRDSSMANDSVATNFEQIFASISPETVRKVL